MPPSLQMRQIDNLPNPSSTLLQMIVQGPLDGLKHSSVSQNDCHCQLVVVVLPLLLRSILGMLPARSMPCRAGRGGLSSGHTLIALAHPSKPHLQHIPLQNSAKLSMSMMMKTSGNDLAITKLSAPKPRWIQAPNLTRTSLCSSILPFLGLRVREELHQVKPCDKPMLSPVVQAQGPLPVNREEKLSCELREESNSPMSSLYAI